MLMAEKSSSKTVIAVTGASGQLGRLVVSRLLVDESVSEVRAIDLAASPLTDPKLVYHQVDIRNDEIADCFEGVDVVIHLAFVVTHYLPRHEFDEINVGGSRNVFECAATKGVHQVIYVSSVAAYGVCAGHSLPIKEDAARVHVKAFPYSSAKFQVEEFLDQFEQQHGSMRIARLRPSILVGTNMNNPLSALFKRALEKGYLVGSDHIPMPLVWDEDVAEACLLAIKNKAHGAFNLSAQELSSTREIAQSLGLRALDPKGPLKLLLDTISIAKARLRAKDAIDPAWSRYGNIPMNQCIEKAKAELGWTPRYNSSLSIIRKFVEELHPEGLPATKATHFQPGKTILNISQTITKRILGG